LHGGLDDKFALFLPAIESSLATSATGHKHSRVKYINNPNLKLDVLEFLKVVISSHSPSIFQSHLDVLIGPVIAASKDKFYKIASEALLVLVELLKVIRPLPSVQKDPSSMSVTVPAAPSANAEKHILSIYAAVL
jgi:hypothetical protein